MKYLAKVTSKKGVIEEVQLGEDVLLLELLKILSSPIRHRLISLLPA